MKKYQKLKERKNKLKKLTGNSWHETSRYFLCDPAGGQPAAVLTVKEGVQHIT